MLLGEPDLGPYTYLGPYTPWIAGNMMCVHTHLLACTCVCACMCVCMHVCIYVCMYTHTHDIHTIPVMREAMMTTV